MTHFKKIGFGQHQTSERRGATGVASRFLDLAKRAAHVGDFGYSDRLISLAYHATGVKFTDAAFDGEVA